MVYTVRRIDYFYISIADQPGEACKLLSMLASLGINLLAFNALPIGPTHTQLTIFPEDTGKLVSEAQKAGLALDGPHPALFVRGDDKLGAFAEVHMQLYESNVNVYASSGLADGGKSFGYVIYVRPEDYSKAAAALGL